MARSGGTTGPTARAPADHNGSPGSPTSARARDRTGAQQTSSDLPPLTQHRRPRSVTRRLRPPISAVPTLRTSPRRRWALTAATVCVGLTVAACGGTSDSSTSSTSSAESSDGPGGGGMQLGGSNPGTSAVQDGTVVGAGQANTAEVAAAAQAFLATLTEEQRETVLYDFDDEAKTTGWSNFPTNLVERNGLSLADLDAEQQAAALAVMEAALSEQGYSRLEAIRAADAYLAANQSDSGDSGGGPGGGLSFGEDLYSIAFFGEPVETGEFMLQFGGHHLAYNLTYAGENVSLSPSLTAIEPSTFEYEGQSYDPLADEKASAVGAVAALTEEQLAAAEIGDSYDDLLLGPQNDGPFPEPQGVLVSELSQETQDQVTAMLRTWVGDIDEEAAEALIAQYVSEYDQTYLGWSEATELDDETTYIRLDGPSAWIEFSNQAGIEVEGVHQHTVFRSQTADYGG